MPGNRPLQALNMKKSCVEVPPWLRAMYATTFFDTCIDHRNKLDRFCIDCVTSLCQNCIKPAHARHKYVKIRKYVYCEVINRNDLCKLFNCSGIQSYQTNKAKVIFLKQRPQQQTQPPYQQHNSRDQHSCKVCKRSLQDSSLYCSIACKVTATFRGEHKIEPKHEHDNAGNEKDGSDNSSYLPLSQMNEVDHKSIDDNEVDHKSIDDEDDIKLSSLKRQKLRKGVALRAPLF